MNRNVFAAYPATVFQTPSALLTEETTSFVSLLNITNLGEAMPGATETLLISATLSKFLSNQPEENC